MCQEEYMRVGRGVVLLTLEAQNAERWLIAGDLQSGHTSLHLERGLYLQKKQLAHWNLLLPANTAGNDRLESLPVATAETSDLSRSFRSLKPLGHLYRVTQSQAHAQLIVYLLAGIFFSKVVLTPSPISSITKANDKMVPALRKILIINPNSTRSMTNALKPLVDSLGYSSVFIIH
jgi:hypothetical protein